MLPFRALASATSFEYFFVSFSHFFLPGVVFSALLPREELRIFRETETKKLQSAPRSHDHILIKDSLTCAITGLLLMSSDTFHIIFRGAFSEGQKEALCLSAVIEAAFCARKNIKKPPMRKKSSHTAVKGYPHLEGKEKRKERGLLSTKVLICD